MVKHAERYIKSYPDDKLVHHKSEFVTQYLKEKYRNPLLLGWQFRQILLAIRIIFIEMVHVSWAKNFLVKGITGLGSIVLNAIS